MNSSLLGLAIIKVASAFATTFLGLLLEHERFSYRDENKKSPLKLTLGWMKNVKTLIVILLMAIFLSILFAGQQVFEKNEKDAISFRTSEEFRKSIREAYFGTAAELKDLKENK